MTHIYTASKRFDNCLSIDCQSNNEAEAQFSKNIDRYMRFRGYIRGAGSALGDYRLSNEEIAAKVDTSDDWIVSRTGIKQRFICSSNSLACTAELGAAAANDALKRIQPIRRNRLHNMFHVYTG